MAREQRRQIVALAILFGGTLMTAAHAAPASTAVSPDRGSDRGKVRVDVSLAGAPPAGSEGLGYFVGEVARTLVEDLRRAGVGVAANGDTLVAFTLEERAGDRVLLSARTRGHHAELEGTVESLDALVEELATRIAPFCPAAPPPSFASTTPDTHRASVAQHGAHLVASSEPPSVPPPITNAAVTTITTVTPPAVPPPATTATPASAPPVVPRPPAPEAKSPVADPYGPDARVADAQTAVANAYMRGRAVVHTLYDPEGAPAGTGSMATQAIYAVLQRHLRLAIVPLGAGVTTPAAAAEEGARAQARVVVMGRLDSFNIYMTQGGPVARMRLELTVVSEGRLVLRRLLYAETPANAVASAVSEGRRGRSIDPVFLAVTHVLESELAELQIALLGPANSTNATR